MEQGGEISRFSRAIRVMVVDDDTTCLSSVAALLRSLKYQVLTVKNPLHALCILRIKASSFDLVITDVHMPDMNGFELQKQIHAEFKLPVVLMSGDHKDAMAIRGMEGGAVSFLLKPVSRDELRNLWQYASLSNPKKNRSGRKMSPNELSSINSLTMKKNKLVWTQELHNHFLQTVNSIGMERAVPKVIHEQMNVPGLSRINIASHLQKYRDFLKKVKEQFMCASIQSPAERSSTDWKLLRSSFAFYNTNLAGLNNLEGASSTQLWQPSNQSATSNYDFGNTNVGDTENNTAAFDINGFARHVSEDVDLNAIFLRRVNNRATRNQDHIQEERLLGYNINNNQPTFFPNKADDQQDDDEEYFLNSLFDTSSGGGGAR